MEKMTKKKLYHVIEYELIQAWHLAVVSKAVDKGWFPPVTEKTRSISCDINDAIDFLVRAYPNEFTLQKYPDEIVSEEKL